jgi:hypothetical protein
VVALAIFVVQTSAAALVVRVEPLRATKTATARTAMRRAGLDSASPDCPYPPHRPRAHWTMVTEAHRIG